MRGGELGVGLAIASFAGAAIVVRPLIGRLIERYGRRAVMVGGGLLAAASGVMYGLRRLAAAAARAARRVGHRRGGAVRRRGHARRRPEPATTAGPRARATSRSPCTPGIGIGPDHRRGRARLARTSAGVHDRRRLRRCRGSGVVDAAGPCRHRGGPTGDVVAARRRARRDDRDRHRPVHAAARSCTAPRSVRVSCSRSGMAAFAVFPAFLPDYSRSLGLSGSGGLFAVYSAVCLVLRVVGAKLPERLGPRTSVTFAFCAARASALALLAAVRRAVGAVDGGGAHRRRRWRSCTRR